MKVILVDLDSLIPNLALMKISAYHKARGDDVYLNIWHKELGSRFRRTFERMYLSCIFSKNAEKIKDVTDNFFFKHLYLGGYGCSTNKLDASMDHLMPDYDLYGIDYSMGFTSRGCVRMCKFCTVWKNEGPIRDYAPITEFHHPDHRKILLMDNNLLGSPRWRENLEYIRNNGLDACLTQGYDARLMTSDAAGLIASVRHFNWKFDNRVIYTAWDNLKDEKAVLRGIQLMIDAGIKPRQITPFVLVNYDTTLEQDLYRFNKLRELGTYPFVMPFNDTPHPMKRWGQRPALFKSCSFEKYRGKKM